MDELLKFSDCKFIHPVGLTGEKYDSRNVLNESTSVYNRLQRDVLQEVELDVYDRGTQLKNPKKIKEYDYETFQKQVKRLLSAKFSTVLVGKGVNKLI